MDDALCRHLRSEREDGQSARRVRCDVHADTGRGALGEGAPGGGRGAARNRPRPARVPLGSRRRRRARGQAKQTRQDPRGRLSRAAQRYATNSLGKS